MFITLMPLWSKSVEADMRLTSRQRPVSGTALLAVTTTVSGFETCLWKSQCRLTLSSAEWLAGAPRWWFNIISQRDWLYALETQHYTAPCRALMLWKTRYHLFILSSFTQWILCWPKNVQVKNLIGRENVIVWFLEMFGMTFYFVLFEKQIQGENAVDAIHFCKSWMHSVRSVLSPCMIAPSPYFTRISLFVPNHNTSHGGTASLEMELAAALSERSGFSLAPPCHYRCNICEIQGNGRKYGRNHSHGLLIYHKV